MLGDPPKRCPQCGSDFIIDLELHLLPPYDYPPASECDDCGYEDYPEAFWERNNGT